jgi:16S rRNA (cytidine1402-2'-O)-methyltransferase
MGGRLVLCGTPIGNLEDMSPRALRVMAEADLIACEDQQRTRKLLTHFGIKPRDISVYNEGNERRRAPELVELIKRGQTVALVSAAGMPGLSDPGYRLVHACATEGLTVEVVPGPSAVVAALALSGLPPARFIFEGFLPRKQAERRRRIEDLASEARTMVLYESPHRIEACLADLTDILGDRPAALIREMTKLHEEVRRGSLPDLLQGSRSDPPRGEIVVVVGGAVRAHAPDVSDDVLADRARSLMREGVERREALREVARAAGVARRRVFDALLRPGDGDDAEKGV